MKHSALILSENHETYSRLINILEKRFGTIEKYQSSDDLLKYTAQILPRLSPEDSGPLLLFIEYPLLAGISKHLDRYFSPTSYILVSFYTVCMLPAADCKNVSAYINTAMPEQETDFFLSRLENEIYNKTRLSMLQFEAMNFYEIGKTLSSEKDTLKLLDMIISSSLSLTSSDAGTIYLVVERENGNWSYVNNNTVSYDNRLLKFVISKNTSMDVKLETFIMPFSKNSISGYTVMSGKSLRIDDAYNIDAGLSYKHDRSFDSSTGYRTKSILSIPMKDNENNIMGVIQLINKKRFRNLSIDYSDEGALDSIITYDQNDDLIMNSLAGQAAVALKNSLLYRGMNNLLQEYKQQNNQLIALGKKILKAHEDERKRVAREIHDGPAQSVVNLALKLELCKRYIQISDYSKAAGEIDAVIGNVRSTAREIRTIIYDLKPSHLEDGLVSSLRNRLEAFSEDTEINATLETSGDDSKIEYYIASTVYNIVQEALNNIQKHALAHNVNVNLSVNESEITFIIRDDGKGFDISQPGQRKSSRLKGGFGLEGMHERVGLVQGKISIESAPGKGTSISVVIPLQ